MELEDKLESVLAEFNTFGTYQVLNFVLLCLPVFTSAVFGMAYVYSAGNPTYRCRIPECDVENKTLYNSAWIKTAIPLENGMPSRCLRFANNFNNETTECLLDNYNQSNVVQCSDFVFENENEVTILNEWNLTCQDNEWKLAMVGTLGSVGNFFGLAMSGYLSDKYGRKMVLILGAISSAVFGAIKAFAWSYESFLFLEFFEAVLNAGLYAAAFILAVEQMPTEHRVLGGIAIACSYSLGQSLLGVLAMYFQNWRHLLLVVYCPAIIYVSYLWIIPESIKWLLINGKTKEAKELILRMVKVNKHILSENSLKTLENQKFETNGDTSDTNYMEVFNSPALLLRVLNCSFCWVTNAFIYYGLSINSVAIGGNKYTNFIFTTLIEVPGYFLCFYMSNRFGRRWTLFSSLIVTGASCMLSGLASPPPGVNLVLFLIGKFAITISFTVLYVYTTELFPTNMRNSLLGTCSTIGRFGSMVAPQTPQLMKYMTSLPALLFGMTATLSGLCVLHFPETLNEPLPDTLQEALVIGKNKSEMNGKNKNLE